MGKGAEIVKVTYRTLVKLMKLLTLILQVVRSKPLQALGDDVKQLIENTPPGENGSGEIAITLPEGDNRDTSLMKSLVSAAKELKSYEV